MLSWPPALLAASHQAGAQVVEGGDRSLSRDSIERVGQLAGQAVGAEQKQVAGLGLQLENIRRHAGFACPERG